MRLFAAALAATLLAGPALAGPAPRRAAPPAAPSFTGVLAGRVTDADTGAPLPGATVVLAGTRYGAAADDEGRFRLVAPAGLYTVEARFVGYAALRLDDVEVAEGETLGLDVELVPAGGDEVVRGEPGDDRDLDARGEREAHDRTDSSRPPVRTGEHRSADRGGTESAAPPAPPAEPSAYGVPGSGDGDAYAEPEATVTPDWLVDEGRRGDPFGRPRSGLLTAGDVDDHLNFAQFLRYARRALQRDGQSLPAVELEDRVTLLLRDRSGRPASNARVRVVPTGQRGRTIELVAGTDGRLVLYPARDLGRGVRRVRLEVRPPSGGAAHVQQVDLRAGRDAPVDVRLPMRASLPGALDLAIVLDVTGSMGDEHRYLADEFESIVQRVQRRYPQVDIRFALVAYRDHGDDFVVRSYGFTRSGREMQARIAAQAAYGGGDWPEAVPEALEAALALDWRAGNTARVLFHVADAPPHDREFDEALAHVDAARAAGIRIYPVAASGATGPAEYFMRAEAVLTQGRHLFLTDDSGIGLPHDEPRVACFVVTPLDRQLARAIEGELAGHRVEPDPQDVVRQVGRYDQGVCRDQPVTYLPPGQGQW